MPAIQGSVTHSTDWEIRVSMIFPISVASNRREKISFKQTFEFSELYSTVKYGFLIWPIMAQVLIKRSNKGSWNETILSCYFVTL